MNRNNPKLQWLHWVLLILLWALPCSAIAAVSLSTTVDKTHLTLDDSLELSVRVNGTTSAEPPVLPSLPDFKVQSAGTSSAIQIINGQRNASVTHRFLLIPQKEGTFALGPVRLDLDGQHYESPPITVTVVAPTVSLPDKESPVFAEAEVSNLTPYLQEQILLTYRLYRKVEVRNTTLDAPLKHFRKVQLGDPTETTRVINGVRYHISEVRYALFPMQVGVLNIPSAIFQMDLVRRDAKGRQPFGGFHFPDPLFNDPFFSGGVQLERKLIRTKPVEIRVQPLPSTGKSETGFSNVTGPLTMKSEWSPKELAVGDTATWTVTLQGRANMNEVQLSAPKATDQFKVYADQPVTGEQPQGSFLEGTKTFKFALVPTRPGPLKTDVIKLEFFDPETKTYETLSAGPLSFDVKPGSGGGSTLPPETRSSSRGSGGGLRPGEDPLLPIHTRPENLTQGIGLIHNAWFLIPGFFLPPVAFFLFRYAYVQRTRMKLDVAFARKQNACPTALNKLEQLRRSDGKSAQNIAREVSLVVREYLGHRYDFQGTALTPGEVETRLAHEQLAPEQIHSARALLDQCQEIEYSPRGESNGTDLVAETVDLIKVLEKSK